MTPLGQSNYVEQVFFLSLTPLAVDDVTIDADELKKDPDEEKKTTGET